jgi:hypothetical protein
LNDHHYYITITTTLSKLYLDSKFRVVIIFDVQNVYMLLCKMWTSESPCKCTYYNTNVFESTLKNTIWTLFITTFSWEHFQFWRFYLIWVVPLNYIYRYRYGCCAPALDVLIVLFDFVIKMFVYFISGREPFFLISTHPIPWTVQCSSLSIISKVSIQILSWVFKRISF